MKKTFQILGMFFVSCLLAIVSVTPASAQSASFNAKNCGGWPMHAFLEIKSTGSQYLSVKGTGDQVRTRSWPGNTNDSVRHYLNSPTPNAKSGYASTSVSSWDLAGWGCSI